MKNSVNKLFTLEGYEVLETSNKHFFAQKSEDTQTNYLSITFFSKILRIGHSEQIFYFSNLSDLIKAIQLEQFLLICGE